MGEIQKGILGGFSGKVGPVVGASWRGKDIVRSRPKKSGKLPSESQLSVRFKFTLVTRFLAPVRPILSAYFGQPEGVKSRRNLATAYHIDDAVAGLFPDYVIDYPKVLFTKGDLLGALDPAAVVAATANINLSWDDNSGQGMAKANDEALIVVYNETQNLFEIRDSAATRSSGSYAVALPENWVGNTVYCWLSFISEDKKKWASSNYLGEFVLV